MSKAFMTAEEADLVERAIVYPLVKKILDKDREEIERSRIRFKDRYYKLIERSIKVVGDKLFTVRKEMTRQNIKVWELKKEDPEGIWYGIRYRGYQTETIYSRHVLRDLTEDTLTDIFNEPKR